MLYLFCLYIALMTSGKHVEYVQFLCGLLYVTSDLVCLNVVVHFAAKVSKQSALEYANTFWP